MSRSNTTTGFWPIVLLGVLGLFVCAACSDDGQLLTDGDVDGEQEQADGDEPDGDAVVIVPDGDGELDGDGDLDVADGDADGDTDADGEFDGDVDGDVDEEGEFEVPDHLPERMPIEFTRDDLGNPIPDAEVTAFTRRLVGLMAKVHYHRWLNEVTYGVHETTGLPPWKLWWTGTHVEKSGDTVTFVNNDPGDNNTGGGHNMMTRSIKILGSASAGYLMTGDEEMKKVVEGFCKGVTATMEGMVYDADDPLHHLMARNVVPAGHSWTTARGNAAVADYSPWYAAGENWNAHRFNYPTNPIWGDVWITNMRSKDDVSRIIRVFPTLLYIVQNAPDAAVQAACQETVEHLELFAQDVVDNDYWIRTKDEFGEPYIPGQSGDDQIDSEAGDLASYGMWDDIMPNAQCHAKRAMAFMGYHDGLDNDCGRGNGTETAYETAAVNIHYFNIWLIRSSHLAHVAEALVHWDLPAARLALEGLVERYTRYMNTAEEDMDTTPTQYRRDLASSLMQAASVGYPLNEDEARLVMQYYSLSVDELKDWPYWDLWDASVTDGSFDWRPPDYRMVEGTEERIDWVRPEDLGAFLDVCWSPLYNENGIRFLDCDIVRDPANWNAAWVDEK